MCIGIFIIYRPSAALVHTKKFLKVYYTVYPNDCCINCNQFIMLLSMKQFPNFWKVYSAQAMKWGCWGQWKLRISSACITKHFLTNYLEIFFQIVERDAWLVYSSCYSINQILPTVWIKFNMSLVTAWSPKWQHKPFVPFLMLLPPKAVSRDSDQRL